MLVQAPTTMLTFGLPPGVRVAGRQSGALAACLRKAVMSRVPNPLPPEVSGHSADNRPHLAYLPLLDAGHPEARTEVLGVGLLFPVERPDLVDKVTAALGDSFELHLAGVRLPLRRGEGSGPLNPQWWTRPSRCWATVTPMVLDRFSGTGKEEVEIRRACVHKGLPGPAAVTISRDPLVSGGAHLGRGDLARRERTPRPFTHARLEFPDPVAGPVLLGAQRYLGMGLCVPAQ
ncbi:type I-G CRISPR-associated protein Csb2 [Saccharopolyspora sp. 5N708]|uniref:type I-G CRISPR-associated protein Csb2 n=1 Tax=Saccharopolyspora sp. 5N708 TaxID=3457424 RepID=UPI003FD3C624